MSRAHPTLLISFYGEITFRALACVSAALHMYLSGRTQISWRFCTRIMINACSAKPRTLLSRYIQVYIISARPAECFRPCHICETTMSKIVICNVIWSEFIWFILDDQPGWWETYTTRWINKFSFMYVIRKKEYTAQSNTIRQIFMTFWKWKTHISFYQFENFNYIESPILIIVWIISNEISNMRVGWFIAVRLIIVTKNR